MARMTGNQFLAEAMRGNGVSHLFFVPSVVGAAMSLMDGAGVKRVITHGEKAAAYMADGYANRVLKLDIEGNILGTLGTSGKVPGSFAYAHHLAVGPNEEIYVAEILNWRVQKFAKN